MLRSRSAKFARALGLWSLFAAAEGGTPQKCHGVDVLLSEHLVDEVSIEGSVTQSVHLKDIQVRSYDLPILSLNPG